MVPPFFINSLQFPVGDIGTPENIRQYIFHFTTDGLLDLIFIRSCLFVTSELTVSTYSCQSVIWSEKSEKFSPFMKSEGPFLRSQPHLLDCAWANWTQFTILHPVNLVYIPPSVIFKVVSAIEVFRSNFGMLSLHLMSRSCGLTKQTILRGTTLSILPLGGMCAIWSFSPRERNCEMTYDVQIPYY